MRNHLIVIISLFLLTPSCKNKPEGPFFGNGIHNGWADQNSVVIWTRLTAVPEMNRTGPGFLRPDASEHRFLRVKGGYLRGNVFGSDDSVTIKLMHCDVDGNVVHDESFTKRSPEL
ncbi:MAG: hypothetical protein JXR67_05350 [Bacteroidales bacterium]|nr:hypothetical protein [Bacteroidales bacterium]